MQTPLLSLRIPFRPTLLSLAVVVLMTGSLRAQEAPQPKVRYYIENGVRYMETRTPVKQTVRDIKYVDMPQTFYMQRFRTDLTNRTSTNYVANTKYECVPRLYDWWRVLGVYGQPYVAYGMEPNTTYQPVTQTAQVPVRTREVVQQTRMAKVAVPQLRIVDREQVSRVAVNAAGTPLTQVAQAQSRQLQRSAQTNVAAGRNRQQHPSVDPYDSNPFGGWGVANRRAFGEGEAIAESMANGQQGLQSIGDRISNLGNGGLSGASANADGYGSRLNNNGLRIQAYRYASLVASELTHRLSFSPV